MKINKIWAKNFMAIGDDQVEIDFSHYGNIINIRGLNGRGKSTIFEIITYALYGKPIRKLSHKEIINNVSKKNLEVGIEFDNCRIIRRRKPDELFFYVDGIDKSLGGLPATQEAIEREIGINYEVFNIVAMFGQHNMYNFLDSTPASKRIIVENLLYLEKYKLYHEQAKETKRSIVKEIESLISNFNIFKNNKNKIIDNISNLKLKQERWKQLCLSQISSLEKEIIDLNYKLSLTDTGSLFLLYQENQLKIKELIDSNKKYKDNIDKVSEVIRESHDKSLGLKSKYQEITIQIKQKESEESSLLQNIKAINLELEKLKEIKSKVNCPYCYGEVKEENFHHIKKHHDNKINSCNEKISNIRESIIPLNDQIKILMSNINKINSAIEITNEKINFAKSKISQNENEILKLQKFENPKLNDNEMIFKSKIENINQTLNQKKEELFNDPYIDIISSSNNDLNECENNIQSIKTKIEEKENLLPYYAYWVDGFGDSGIRSYIIDDILPVLNAKINYWLQFLMDGKISVKFDNQLNEDIIRNDNSLAYHGVSGGEQRRINLAISQAFAYTMMFSTGTCPSLIALDEVAVNLDSDGVNSIYKMICELASDRQVLVVTHDNKLLDLLQGADEIKVDLVNGFTTFSGK